MYQDDLRGRTGCTITELAKQGEIAEGAAAEGRATLHWEMETEVTVDSGEGVTLAVTLQTLDINRCAAVWPSTGTGGL
ncbi:hypothetical protein scyTo_0018478 [Scyliorhinus torazame]|uniref:Uncharacterized protein n=1 Tax=Scyliorhinus torazame TaxID=75743 RepID=A0A401PWH6_SCYTO|nr:hypothetical protein [Scyliorhinus torazame]